MNHPETAQVRSLNGYDGIEQEHIFEQYTNVLRALASHRPIVLNGGDIELQLSEGFRATKDGSEQLSEQALEFVSAYIDAAYSPHNLDEDVIRLIAERTGGHPLFTIELLRSLEDRDWLTRAPSDGSNDDSVWICECALELDALPPRVEAVVTERIDRLTDEQRRVLTVASVEGNEFTAQVIAQIEGLKDLTLVRLLEEELQRRHRLIEELGVKRVNGQMLFLYQFRHRLFQRYLYDQMGTAQRLMLHDAVGEALETLYGDNVHDLEVTLAHHFLAAGNDAKALKYLVAAGDHAWSHHANHEALAHYDKALEAASQLGDAVDPEMIQELHTRRAQVQGWLGHVDEAVPDYERALEIARERDAPSPSLRSGSGQAVAGQVYCLYRMGTLLAGPRGFREGVRHVQQALEIARKAGDKPGIIDSLNRLGNFQANLGALADAAASHQEALALACELGDDRRVADSLDGLRLARYDEQVALLKEVVDIRRRLGDQKATYRVRGPELTTIYGQPGSPDPVLRQTASEHVVAVPG